MRYAVAAYGWIVSLGDAYGSEILVLTAVPVSTRSGGTFPMVWQGCMSSRGGELPWKVGGDHDAWNELLRDRFVLACEKEAGPLV
jgi:hypothetical protein